MISSVPYVLTVSGSDSSGCAGMQADNRAIHAAGAMPLNVITANTLQTPEGVLSVEWTDAAVVEQQMRALLKAYPVQAVKLGMLGNAAIVTVVAHVLKEFTDVFTVLDPVILATSGWPLLNVDGLAALNRDLLPQVSLVTPNGPERSHLVIPEGVALLVKGGHMSGAASTDVLTLGNGHTVEFHAERLQTRNTRGSGCVLSALIAACMASGMGLTEACSEAKAILHRKLSSNVANRFQGDGPAFF